MTESLYLVTAPEVFVNLKNSLINESLDSGYGKLIS